MYNVREDPSESRDLLSSSSSSSSRAERRAAERLLRRRGELRRTVQEVLR